MQFIYRTNFFSSNLSIFFSPKDDINLSRILLAFQKGLQQRAFQITHSQCFEIFLTVDVLLWEKHTLYV